MPATGPRLTCLPLGAEAGQELRKFRKFMESHYKQFFGPCILRVSVSAGISCLTNLLAEVQARIALLARGKKRKADEPVASVCQRLWMARRGALLMAGAGSGASGAGASARAGASAGVGTPWSRSLAPFTFSKVVPLGSASAALTAEQARAQSKRPQGQTLSVRGNDGAKSGCRRQKYT